YASFLLAATDERLRGDDRALCYELVLGVLRRQSWLDRALEHFANRRLKGLDLPVKLALRLGLYQLRFLSRIPPSAAVNESVNLVRAAGLRSAATFANAVLRRATREPDYDPVASVTDPVEKVAIETSHPEWLIDRWVNAFGFDEAAALARANNEPAPVAFRLTAKAFTQTETSQQIIQRLGTSGVRLAPSEITPGAWRVMGYRTARGSERVETAQADNLRNPQARTPALLRELARDGLIYFQDEASQLVAHLLDAQTGDRVLDVCAAPGSKTTHIGTLAPGAMIVAGDLYEHRLRTLRELATTQGNGSIRLVTHDAEGDLPFADVSFDRVLVDAPCAGTGTLRRNPEIRWRIGPADIAELSSKQTRILRNAARMVRPGGTLLYSTCSLEKDENEVVAEAFIKEHVEFNQIRPDAAGHLLTESGAIRTWPHRQDVNGFFMIVFQRRM
ncbi:MAG: 16S rRNA (cytosine(967)-C(5))-methyltransferase RsmB, partial [Pyrinomonadaceae bacterium]